MDPPASVSGRADLLAQLRRGALEYCVLALLRDGERYAFDLVRTLGEVAGLATGEGTLYPLLGRLRRTGAVDSAWRESAQGPPRRYYRLTPSGRAALAAFVREWIVFRDGVDALVGTKGVPDGQAC